MRIQRFLIGCLLSIVACSALAFDRPFPANAKRGVMSPAGYPFIVIDGNTRKLSAGVQIRNRDNLIQVPNALNASEYVINYSENAQKEIHRIWILTPAEIAVELPAK